MSIWSIVESVGHEVAKMKSFYDQKGIYEIRVIYATWIEERISRENSTTSDAEEAAFQFYDDLEEYIRISPHREYNYSAILNRLTQTSKQELYNHLTEGIDMELLLFGNMKPNYKMHKLKLLNELFKSCDCEQFYQLPNLLIELKTNAILNNECNIYIDYLKRIFHQYNGLQNSVFEELKNWLRQKIWIYNEKHQDDSLNQIQSCVEQLAEVNFRMLQLIESIRMQSSAVNNERLDELARLIKTQHENLILNSFVVENQPNRVMKTHGTYSTSGRWLIGPKLGLHKSKINVECKIVSEADIAKLLCDGKSQVSRFLDASSGEILGMTTMQYQEPNRLHFANFNLSLRIRKTTSRRELEGPSKFDEKFALLLSFPVIINGSSFKVWTLSLPIMLLVHSNPESQAWATIFWNNAFLQIGRGPSDKITWDELSKALYLQFVSLAGQGYTNEHEKYLYEKLFQNGDMMTPMNPKAEISWEKFCIDPMLNYSFTFWDWFYHSMKLIQEHLVTPWNLNLIEGYISKKSTEERLKLCKTGTFLLRFSDSLKGAITVSYVNDHKKIDHIQPWTSRDLKFLCLVDRLKTIDELTNLFPTEMNKCEVFEKFCSPKKTSSKNILSKFWMQVVW